ncbi:hypothetical protein MJA45_08655 [Paenibacillus aurantius]|uniref:Uncharacterized protein n=1 Tax=Paenibacillus aurantius TaxID=2918900 RepID=A0AA96RJB9_9BACL|nr:hypothetical protein [Paenibacillus aurantius]WNQ13079.1 hypothetical protein MJA45_08655 [Paenibacillus aurantius]
MRPQQEIVIDLLPEEAWWGGVVNDGIRMPFPPGCEMKRDLNGHLAYNQGAPLLLSNKGGYVWSEEPFRFVLMDGQLRITGTAELIRSGRCGDSLREGYLHASQTFFPSSGNAPDRKFFNVPQYNTWM